MRKMESKVMMSKSCDEILFARPEKDPVEMPYLVLKTVLCIDYIQNWILAYIKTEFCLGTLNVSLCIDYIQNWILATMKTKFS